MTPRQSLSHRFTIPAIAAVIVLFLTAGLWHALLKQERAQIMETTRDHMSAFQRDLQSQILVRVLGVGRIARRLELENNPKRDEWEQTTELDRVQLGGLLSIAWVDTTFTVRWITPVNLHVLGMRVPTDSTRLQALALARRTRSPVLTRPIWIRLNGVSAVLVYAPVGRHGRYDGHVGGVLSIDSIVRPLIEHDLQGYVIELTDHGESITTLNGTSAVPATWRTSVDIPMHGTVWHLEVWPNEAQLHAQRNWLPEAVLAVGIILATLLVWTVLAAQSARATARRMTIVNARLKDENEARRLAEHTAELASRSKSDFLARMSHELRTPLNSVIGFANVLLKNRGDRLIDADLEFIERIRANGLHLLGLVNNILDVSKIEAGHMTIERSDVDLAALIRDTIAELDGQPRAASVTLQVHVPSTPAILSTDSTKVRQVLVNLVGNALKFTPAGSVTVALETNTETGAPTKIVVMDTGIGILPERQASIFDPFEQGDNTTMRKYGGTGLGLSISRMLCELLGYELTLQSTPGTGSIFTIRLA